MSCTSRGGGDGCGRGWGTEVRRGRIEVAGEGVAGRSPS